MKTTALSFVRKYLKRRTTFLISIVSFLGNHLYKIHLFWLLITSGHLGALFFPQTFLASVYGPLKVTKTTHKKVQYKP